MRTGSTVLSDHEKPAAKQTTRLLAEPDRSSRALTVAFGAAAVIGAVLRFSSHYAHGWWLVAYLLLVGAVAQLLLAPGGTWVALRFGAVPPAQRRWWALGLWNLGTVLVPIGVFVNRASPVLLGSALLLASLGLYASGVYRAASAAPRRSRAWAFAYFAVVAGLAGSVLVGAALAGALPLPD
ncbi:MAG: hypothetical protein ACR2HC_00790 [Thermoleophilaceae bacterium]